MTMHTQGKALKRLMLHLGCSLAQRQLTTTKKAKSMNENEKKNS